MAHLLMKNGGNIQVRNNLGESPLDQAIENGNFHEFRRYGRQKEIDRILFCYLDLPDFAEFLIQNGAEKSNAVEKQ